MNCDLIVLSKTRRPYKEMSDDDLATLKSGALVRGSMVEVNAEVALRRLLARTAP